MGRRTVGAPLGLVAAACASILGGCSADGSPDGNLPRWSVVEELRIGSLDEPMLMLTTVSSLAVDDDGTMYIAQPENGTIRVFNSVGTLINFIGRRGQGPGEFDRVYTIGLLADTLYAIDLGLRRISYFSLEGELLRSTQVSPPPISPPFLPSMPFAVFPGGSMAVGTAFPASISADDLRRVPQLRIDRTGQILDTVTWISYERTGRRAMYEGRPLGVGSPLSDDAFALFSPDGSQIATVDRTVAAGSGTASFGITMANGSGDTIYARRYEYTPIPIDGAVIDSTVAERARILVGAFDEPRAAAGFVRGTMFLPVYYPPVSTISFSASGNLWVRREGIPGRSQSWTVLDQTGEPIAEARLPENLDAPVIRGDAIWGVQPDEFGVPYVVRYRIDR